MALDLFRQAYAIEPQAEFLLNEWGLLDEIGNSPSDTVVEERLERHRKNRRFLLYAANRSFSKYQAARGEADLQRASEHLSIALADILPRLESARDRSAVTPLDCDWVPCALNTLAGVVYWQGDLDRADSLLELALLFGDEGQFYFTRGQIRMAQGRTPDAIALYKKARALGFDQPDLWNQLGNAHYLGFRKTRSEEDFKAADDCYLRAVKSLPASWINLAQLWWDHGDREKARLLVRRALAANPNDPTALCNSLLYSTEGDPDRILAEMPPIEAAHPNHPTVLSVIGEAYYHLTNWEKAFAYFERAVEAAGPNALLLDQVYPKAAVARKRMIGGSKGAAAAMEYLLAAAKRLPTSMAIQEKLQLLARDEPVT